MLQRLSHRSRIPGERQENHPRHALRQQHLDPGQLARAVALRVAEHRGIAARSGLPLDRLRHFRVERIGQVADHHAQDVRPLLHELPGQDVRAVAQLLDRRVDLAPRLPRHADTAPNHIGYCRLRDSRSIGNVQYGRRSPHVSPAANDDRGQW